MNDIILFETDSGVIQIESSDRSRPVRGGGDAKSKKASQKFEEALGVIKKVGNSVVEQVRSLAESPDEVSIEVGFKFSVEAGAIIAKTATEGTMKLKLVWKKKAPESTDKKQVIS